MDENEKSLPNICFLISGVEACTVLAETMYASSIQHGMFPAFRSSFFQH